MPENIKFKELRGRIDNTLLQLSGLAPTDKSRIELLESLYKEFEHELKEDEKNKVIQLFRDTLTQKNMVKSRAGRGFNEKIIYVPDLAFLNMIELELRRLLGVHAFYSLTKNKKDFKRGEF